MRSSMGRLAVLVLIALMQVITLQQCLPENNERFNGISCVCLDGFVKSLTGECVSICRGSHESWNGYQCVCNFGFQRRGEVCIEICGQNQINNGFGCVCAPGYHYNHKGDECVSNCGSHSFWQTNRCVCSYNYLNIMGICRYCPNGNCFCPDGFFCQFMCGETKRYDGSKCVCKSEFFPIADGSCSPRCREGWQYDQQTFQCIQIPTIRKQSESCVGYRQWNEETKKCECLGQDDNGLCRPCGLNQRFNGDKCVCLPGYFIINNLCQMCDADEEYDGQTCVRKKIGFSEILPLRTNILPGQLLQGLRIYNLPSNITKNQCKACYDLLQIKIIDSPTQPIIGLQYKPSEERGQDTSASFMAVFVYDRNSVLPIMTYSVQINPKYSNYFSEDEMNRVKQQRIDPATLSTIFQNQRLLINEISPQLTGREIQEQVLKEAIRA